ncbi:hypothetical protein SMICM304S_01287 [Streptomyces microflavus]
MAGIPATVASRSSSLRIHSWGVTPRSASNSASSPPEGPAAVGVGLAALRPVARGRTAEFVGLVSRRR